MTQDSLVEDGFQLEEWRVEPRLGRMVRDQVIVTLRPRVMEALTFLAGRPGEVVSKRDLVDAVWSSGFVADNTIVHCINELRDALGDNAASPRFLQTIPRRGYRVLGRIGRIEEEDASVTFEEAGFHLLGKRWAAFLIDGDNLIGRGGEARIIVPSTRVSRHHARITASGDRAVVEDLESKNGTFVDEQRVTTPTVLRDGATLKFADLPLVFLRQRLHGPERTESMEKT